MVISRISCDLFCFCILSKKVKMSKLSESNTAKVITLEIINWHRFSLGPISDSLSDVA